MIVRPLNSRDLVLLDFDGTVSLEDHGLAAMERYSPVEGWEIEMRWRRGEISSMECLRRQYGLLELAPEEFAAFVDSVKLDASFPELVALCREKRAALAILSDGLDLYVNRHLEREGLSDLEVYSNHAWFEGRKIQVQFPHRSEQCAQCGNCKTAHLFRLRRGRDRTIYIGDGYSDLCPARYADVVLAKDVLAETMAREGRRYYPFADLSEVIRTLTDGVAAWEKV